MSRPRIVLVFALAAIALLVIAGCGGSGADSGPIDNARFRELQAEGARIVDVRTPSEFAAGRIPGAENVPVSSLAATAEAWDRDEPVVVYCAVGARSREAAAVLRAMGFKRVYDLTAGIAEWDGEFEAGAEGATVTPPEVVVTGLPIMYEFFTDG